MDRLTTKMHGQLDYLSVIVLLLTPRILRWNGKMTNLLTALAAGTLTYSAITKYEWGVTQILPMRGHLLLDAMSGIFLIMAPKLLRVHNPLYRTALVSFGLFQIAAASATDLPEEETPEHRSQFVIPVDVEQYVRE
jgi:hypothetical protein